MPNPYFEFKQFTVYHDRCAMKVGTDGVLLGAWADVSKAATALDIGTGSGLIALMLAQRNANIKVSAIDIDAGAIEQTGYNIDASPFNDRIYYEQVSLQDLADKTSMTYDLIVSNPPFFRNSLKSPDVQRSNARHTDTLSMEELIPLSAKLLSQEGRLTVIYPYEYMEAIRITIEQNELYINRITKVYPTPSSQIKRILIEASKTRRELAENELIIETGRHGYSPEFKELTKDFYIKN